MGLFNSLGHSLVNFVSDYNVPGISQAQSAQAVKDAHNRIDNQSLQSNLFLDDVNSSIKKGFNSLSDAINNGFGAYSSSALAFEREALQNQQDFNSRQAELAFERSQSSVREQMDFQKSERLQAQAYNTLMSNTQYQRAVDDLRKAGINPILAVQGLSGSAPTVQAMSGSSVSSSPASSSKADYTSALKEDKQAINIMIDMLSSSLSLFKLFRK